SGRGSGRRSGAARDYFGTAGPSWHLMANGGIHSTAMELAAWFDSALEGKMAPKELTEMFIAAIERGTGPTRHLEASGSNVVFTAQYLNFRDSGLVVVLLTSDSMWPKERVMPDLLRQIRPLYAPQLSGQ